MPLSVMVDGEDVPSVDTDRRQHRSEVARLVRYEDFEGREASR